MAGRRHDWKPGLAQHGLERCRTLLVPLAFGLAGLEVPNAGKSTRSKHRRDRCRKDETGRVGAHHIDEPCRRSDIAAHDPKGLRKRAIDHIDTAHDTVTLRHASASRTVHAYGVHLVKIGHRPIPLGNRADLADGRDVTIHRIDGLEGHNLRSRRIGRSEKFLEVGDIIVSPDHPLGAAVTHAFDHRRMV